ncbi:MAG TPA: hypothetical protein VK086_06455 [Ruania sp.]|nr:hypothetical protein [Ruania sp.]
MYSPVLAVALVVGASELEELAGEGNGSEGFVDDLEPPPSPALHAASGKSAAVVAAAAMVARVRARYFMSFLDSPV